MDKEEFSRRVLEAESSLYRVAKTILRNDEDCADAIQSGILKAFQRLDTLREKRYFKTWLTRLLIYQLIMVWSQKVPNKEMVLEKAVVQEKTMALEKTTIVEKMMVFIKSMEIEKAMMPDWKH